MEPALCFSALASALSPANLPSYKCLCLLRLPSGHVDVRALRLSSVDLKSHETLFGERLGRFTQELAGTKSYKHCLHRPAQQQKHQVTIEWMNM